MDCRDIYDSGLLAKSRMLTHVTLGGKKAAEIIIHYSVAQLWGKDRGKPLSIGLSMRIRTAITPS